MELVCFLKNWRKAALASWMPATIGCRWVSVVFSFVAWSHTNTHMESSQLCDSARVPVCVCCLLVFKSYTCCFSIVFTFQPKMFCTQFVRGSNSNRCIKNGRKNPKIYINNYNYRWPHTHTLTKSWCCCWEGRRDQRNSGEKYMQHTFTDADTQIDRQQGRLTT